jgi:hypothetical protein
MTEEYSIGARALTRLPGLRPELEWSVHHPVSEARIHA